MFTVFIADDEAKVISGLIHRVNWKKLDAHVVGYAEDGKEARDRILELNPDIVITDIYMPGMTGIELINELSDLTDSVFIIFSAYSEFEYAREAIRLKVVEYLIKPVNIREIEKTLEQAETRVMEKRRSSTKKNEEYLLMKLLDGSGAGEEEMILEDGAAIMAAVVGFEDAGEALLNVRLDAEGWKLINGRVYTLQRGKRLIIIGVQKNYDTDGSLRRWLLQKLRELRQNRDEAFYWGLGCLAESWKEVGKSVYSAEEMLDYSEFYREQVEGARAGETEELPPGNFADYADDLARCLEDPGRSGEIREQIIRYLKESVRDTEQVKARMVELLYRFRAALEENSGRSRGERKEGNDPDRETEVIYRILKSGTLEEIIRIFDEVICRFRKQMEEQARESSGGLAGIVQNYIRHNLKKNITLNDIAQYVGRNPAYVSHVFREETGEALFEYITRLRMERAIQLLRESQMKIQDIAAEVGYEEQSYFSQVFKKYTGRTAGSYRKTKAGTVL